MSQVCETDAKSNFVVERRAATVERSGWLGSNTCAIPPALRQGAIFFAASSLAGALNYVYHVLMGRMLGPDDYGAFSSLVAILVIFSVSTSVVQTVVAHKLGFKLAGE